MNSHDSNAVAPSPDAYVRPALAEDAAALGAIQVASWRITHATELGADVIAAFREADFATAWGVALARHAASPAHRLLAACAGPRVVGFAALQPSPDPDMAQDGGVAQDRDGGAARELTALFVLPECWRQGHGSRLLAAACDTARDGGAALMLTWVSEGDEARAAFLRSAGFDLDGAWRSTEIAPGRVLTERRWAAALG